MANPGETDWPAIITTIGTIVGPSAAAIAAWFWKVIKDSLDAKDKRISEVETESRERIKLVEAESRECQEGRTQLLVELAQLKAVAQIMAERHGGETQMRVESALVVNPKPSAPTV